MHIEGIKGVPKFSVYEWQGKSSDYCVLIPIINEGDRIHKELFRAQKYGIGQEVDIIICDGGSTDGCTDEKKLKALDVNTLLVKEDIGKQGAQLRMGIWWALSRGYQGIITIDGNNKDSIEDIPRFVEKLKEGYDLDVTGIRKLEGGVRKNAYKSCFDNNDNKYDRYRPIFWFNDDDKMYYRKLRNVANSKCYTIYGLKRTGCCGCPFGRNYKDELNVLLKFEPKLYKASINIFKDSYDYTQKYKNFIELNKIKERLK